MRSKPMAGTVWNVTEAQEKRLRKAGFFPVMSWRRLDDEKRYTTKQAEALVASGGGRATVAELILWRRDMLPPDERSPRGVAISLSVECLPDAGVPDGFKAAVTAFRHLRQDRRVAACRRALAAAMGGAR